MGCWGMTDIVGATDVWIAWKYKKIEYDRDCSMKILAQFRLSSKFLQVKRKTFRLSGQRFEQTGAATEWESLIDDLAEWYAVSWTYWKVAEDVVSDNISTLDITSPTLGTLRQKKCFQPKLKVHMVKKFTKGLNFGLKPMKASKFTWSLLIFE